MSAAPVARRRPDRCPGIVHPWPADDGGLVRIRVPGGQLPLASLEALLAVAGEYGDGRVHVTGRANLQLRAMPLAEDRLAEPAVVALERAGLLPSRHHDRVRNVLVSPQTGLAGGRADLRPLTVALDGLLLTDPVLATLPGRFLFTLDDGRGDLADRHRDLGLVALSRDSAQLLVGDSFGPVVWLSEAAQALAELARGFVAARGSGPTAAWHVTELTTPLGAPLAPAPGADVRSGPLPWGPVPAGVHHQVDDAGFDAADLAAWMTGRPPRDDRTSRRSPSDRHETPAAPTPAPTVVVTPWRGVLVPDPTEQR